MSPLAGGENYRNKVPGEVWVPESHAHGSRDSLDSV